MKNKKIRILIAAGEQSGSNIANTIITNLKKIYVEDEIELYGIVADSFKKEHKINEIFPMNQISVMGFSGVLKKIFSIFKKINLLVSFVKNNHLDLIITVDSYDFFYRVVKRIRQFNKKIPIFHVVSPSVWLYRKNRAKKMAEVYDMLLCIFPHEPQYFEATKLKTFFVGNPIFDAKFQNPEKNLNQICITVGSRMQEIQYHAPIILETIKILNSYSNDLKFRVLSTVEMLDSLSRFFLGVKNVSILTEKSDKDIAMNSASIAICKSGTNVLEFVAAKTVPVIYYKTSVLNAFLAYLIGVRFVSIFNIIEHREIFKEFVQWNAKPKKIAEYIIKLLADKNFFNKEQKKLEQVHEMFMTNFIDNFSSFGERAASLIAKEYENIQGRVCS